MNLFTKQRLTEIKNKPMASKEERCQGDKLGGWD